MRSSSNRAFTIESASKLVQTIMERRGIGLETFFNVEEVDPGAGTVTSLEGDKKEYDLLVLVPPHRGEEVVEASGLGDPGGWMPTDRATLRSTTREGGRHMSTTIARKLDLKTLSCPLPIVKTAQAMRELGAGELIEVEATDPGSVPDFAAWCQTTGNELVDSTKEDGVYRFLVRKKG